ncbi:efflux RND transporter periplasmic adaptor subunit [Metabacillus litoralis]|uniref:efflux RND transporter periplasmic adaptor subunit n=1 Tax=Metabacillus litoralis TaxID=152268 RepID=UPI001B9976AD|nr:efflux RND transporter periplasmic adaptor subunit [Metabacillus litoralis]UHA61522.1 efflux RND transporter periplasmic adaptor subunit [Metabacillus litoralis]
MKRWVSIVVAVIVIGFIGTNVYLIFKEDSKVQHTVHVEKWNRVQERDIVETFETDGILVPKEKQDVYLPLENIEFQQFLVEEGDEVAIGTPLFLYTSPEIDSLKETLESDITQVEGEIEGVEDYIDSLEDYQRSIPTTTSEIEVDSILEDGLKIDVHASSEMIESTIEQEIYKQELEKRKLEEQKAKYENQLDNINEKENSASMVSNIDGVVVEVNKNLGNPIITIASNELAIEGEFSEQQLKKAETGMKLTATASGEKKMLEGTLDKINPYPVDEPALDQKNAYKFVASILEQPETSSIGTKTTVSVVTAEVSDVPAVRDGVIHGKKTSYVYKLNKNGQITKNTIEKGLSFDGYTEIVEGAEIGEVAMLTPGKTPQTNTSFVTEMKPKQITKVALKDFTSREVWKYILIGLVER